MQAVRYHEYGDPGVLRIDDVERPEPRRKELLVEVKAAGINPLDTKLRSGAYDWMTPPAIPGSDFAGVVADTGPDVADFEVGDRVFGTGLGIDRPGTCAEYARASLEHVAHLPDEVSFEEGAAVALVGVTSWEGLVETADLKAGDRCLIHGASGGNGHVAVQIAAAVGASVTGTASPQYHDRVSELGADTVVDYSRDDIEEALEEPGAPDVILDHRIDEYIDLNTRICAQGARIVAISGTKSELVYSNSGAARGKMQTLHHFAMPKLPTFAPALERVATLSANGDLSPVVDRTYDLESVADAHRDVVEDSFLGKLVVVP